MNDDTATPAVHPAPTGATGKDACPVCGHAYDDHGQGGNCQATSRPRRHTIKPKGQ